LGSSGTVYVFTGPTIDAAEARAELDAIYLPPVSQGDVYRVARTGPWAIGIIDGYFERVPAVWHKEILWALAQGIHVYGAASMGALRAAELAVFGMEGVGEIFAQYHDGRLEDDDEVAVVHGPAEHGYVAMSEAMVNIRATLAAATDAAIIAPATASALTGIAKALFYPERTYPHILRNAVERGLSNTEIAGLEQWLAAGRIDQKRADAVRMLQVVGEHRSRAPLPKPVSFILERSPYSMRAEAEAGEYQPVSGGDHRAVALTAVLDELRLEAGGVERVFDGALHRHLLAAEAARRGLTASDGAVAEATRRFQTARGLTTPEQLDRWLDSQSLSAAQFARLLQEEVVLAQARRALRREALAAVPNHLKASGEFGRYAARALDKQQTLDRQGLAAAGEAQTSVTQDALLEWFFARLSQPVPSNPAEYAVSIGLDLDLFLRALYREYCFVELADPPAKTGEPD
jgi:hypothetical protein